MPMSMREAYTRYNHSPKGLANRLRFERTPKGRESNAKKKAEQRRNDPQWHARARARDAVRSALKRGDLVRPTTCPRCGKTPPLRRDGRSRIQFHHAEGYAPENHLVGEFLCEMCHRAED